MIINRRKFLCSCSYKPLIQPLWIEPLPNSAVSALVLDVSSHSSISEGTQTLCLPNKRSTALTVSVISFLSEAEARVQVGRLLVAPTSAGTCQSPQ